MVTVVILFVNYIPNVFERVADSTIARQDAGLLFCVSTVCKFRIIYDKLLG
jgi:hypothetical protein